MPKPKKQTIGELIDRGGDIELEIKALNARLKVFQDEKKELQSQIIETMTEQGTTVAGDGKYTASVNEEEVYSIEDGDSFFKFLIRNKAPWLLQRRLAQKALMEMIQERKGRAVPGIATTKIKKLSFRKKPAR